MLKNHTYLHLSILLKDKIHINQLDLFLLGSIYPNGEDYSFEKTLQLHYKKNTNDTCQLTTFLQNEKLDDFHLGYYFHLWVDNYVDDITIEGMHPYDYLICDMDAIHSYIMHFYGKDYYGQEKQAFHNFQLIEKQPMPLYIVSQDIKDKYAEKLISIIKQFLKESEIIKIWESQQ